MEQCILICFLSTYIKIILERKKKGNDPAGYLYLFLFPKICLI